MKKQLILSLVALITCAGFISLYFFASPNRNAMLMDADFLDFPPGGSYAEEWRKADSLLGQGLTQEARVVIDQIYAKAKQEQNHPQVAKAVLYILSCVSRVEDESVFLNFTRMEQEIAQAPFPLKPVLQSILAEHYTQYYTANAWRFGLRTDDQAVEESDPRTWDIQKIVRNATSLYLASIEDFDSLRRVEVGYFGPILEQRVGSELYRPTLYDLLAHRAIAFFANETYDVSKVGDRFALSGAQGFGSNAEFIQQEFPTADSGSHLRQALLIHQKLARLHQGGEDKRPSTQLAMERLAYVHRVSTAEDKGERYLSSLADLQASIRGEIMEAEVAYEQAMQWLSTASQFDALAGDAHKSDRTKALQLISPFLNGANTRGGQNCKVAEFEIKRRELELRLDRISSVGKPFLAILRYRNYEQVRVRVVAVPDALAKDWNGMEQHMLMRALEALKPVQDFLVTTPGSVDYNHHSIEFPVQGLPAGRYALLVQGTSSDAYADNPTHFAPFDVSDIAYFSRGDREGDQEHLVTDRNTGMPLKGVKVQVYTQEYDYNRSRYVRKLAETTVSDEQGIFRVSPGANGNRQYFLSLEHKGVRLEPDGAWYAYRPYKSSNAYRSTLFFTDRAIYRPGQTIYFKGLLLQYSNGKASIRPKASTTVTFVDVNSEEIATLKLTSNEFGTVSGSFTAPQGLLNGAMTIRDEHGEKSISVEDYKRPKFEVLMDPVKGSHRLGGEVKVTGKAKAYAGSSVDGAEVKYRVVRSARYPYCDWWWWRPRPSSPEVEIAHGSVTTAPDGSFALSFNAIPDRKVDPSSKPEFHYKVMVDVVDITGETQSTETSVAVGTIAMSFNASLPAVMRVGQQQHIGLYSRNLNGEFEAAKGTLKVALLKKPSIQYQNRTRSLVEHHVLSEAAHKQTFPHVPYGSEDQPRSWAVASNVLDTRFDTGQNDSIDLGKISNWQPGTYRLDVETEDKFGTKITVQHHFIVLPGGDGASPTTDLLKVYSLGGNYEPGQEALYAVTVGEDETMVLIEVHRKDAPLKREWKKLNAGTHLMRYPVAESDRGGFGVQFFAVKHSSASLSTNTAYVPWSNKELKLAFGTFRSKLWPGQEETWTMTVSGNKGERLAAEVLAGMYDASLDAFSKNDWSGWQGFNPSYQNQLYWEHGQCFQLAPTSQYPYSANPPDYISPQEFDHIIGVYYAGYAQYDYGWDGDMELEESGNVSLRSGAIAYAAAPPSPAATAAPKNVQAADGFKKRAEEKAGGESSPKDRTATPDEGNGEAQQKPVQVRTNLNETAFFFPHLLSNTNGELTFSFRIPEALTRWRFMSLAHTPDLRVGYNEATVVTQKDLMVMPNPPRFFREGDKVVFTAKVSNLSESELSGTATLELLDAVTMQPVGPSMGLNAAGVPFSAKPGQSALVEWPLTVPAGLQGVTYRVIARAGSFSDGEEAALPVLTNRMLVTESMPLPVRAKETKTFNLAKLSSNTSTTLRHHKVTLEFSSNPAWYAVQALPYMMEYPYECIEQTFSRYYANALATHVANAHPRIKAVFDAWASQPGGKEALLSNLEKNQELKALLLEETPWVMDAHNESERKKRVALLFDLNRMAHEQDRALNKVIQAQVSNGAWPWFPGGPENRYMTQHVVSGMGHLDRLGVKAVRQDQGAWKMVQKAAAYLDRVLAEDLDWLKRHKANLEDMQVGSTQVHLLHARSYFKDLPVAKGSEEAYGYYLGQAKKFWLKFGRYEQGMIALVLNRGGDQPAAQGIIKSLKQNAMRSDEMGMYWKENTQGYYWYQAPIETHSLLIEAFDEVTGDQGDVEEMKLWLLKQKQTQDWKTTKATAEACYALLLRGTDLLSQSQIAEVTVGGKRVDPGANPDLKAEAGTGYFKTSWSGSEITPAMGQVTVKNQNQVAAWGALYWQYFEQLDKITFAKTNVEMAKGLFIETITDQGPKLTPVKAGDKIKTGDKVKVRIILKADRDLEYVHLKDMRASGFEPIDVISKYRWQDGLGYYQSTRDAATNFFIDYLRKGTYVFEYALRATHQGDFSNGITTLQCMYAPEFTTHSEGIRVSIGK